jgi:hypothetical protein
VTTIESSAFRSAPSSVIPVFVTPATTAPPVASASGLTRRRRSYSAHHVRAIFRLMVGGSAGVAGRGRDVIFTRTCRMVVSFAGSYALSYMDSPTP